MSNKASDQVKQIRASVSVSNHRFFNMITDGVLQKLEDSVKGLKLKKAGSAITATGGTSVIMGQMTVASVEEKEEIDAKVRQAVDGLKNPADLLSTIR